MGNPLFKWLLKYQYVDGYLQLWPCIRYNWLFLWGYTFYKWEVLITGKGP